MTEETTEVPLLSWEASEYAHHHKPMTWYLGFGLIGIITAALIYLILKDILGVVVVALMFIALLVYAIRKPETLRYSITTNSLAVGPKHYALESFRSFSINREGGVPSILFEPLRRFAPQISVFCEPENVDKIVEILGRYLPQTDKRPDAIDRLAHYLRF